ncbi:MAG: amidohydrolase family protein [Pseudomonadota bacterium]
MDDEVIPNGSIIIENGVITKVSAENIVEPDLRTIDASGLTALPGLVDMHVHYWAERDGPLYIANGVTTVRNMWGAGQTIRLDHGAEAGDFIGPKVYSPGPLIDGLEPVWGDASLIVENVEQAIGAIRAQKAIGFESIKLYEKLNPEVFQASITEAKRLNMQIYTHTPQDMSITEVLKLQPDSLEHFDDAEEYLASDDFEPSFEKLNYLSLWASADPAKMPILANLFAENSVSNCATLAVTIRLYQTKLALEQWSNSKFSKYIEKPTMNWWRNSARRSLQRMDNELVSSAREKQLLFLKSLYDANAPLLIGTDTPNPFVVPGFSIHDEIADFIEAGIPIKEVLKIATRGAAEFLKADGDFGRIAEGLRANIILVEGNPLEDVAVLRTPTWVISNGRSYNREQLDEMLDVVRENTLKTYEEETQE